MIKFQSTWLLLSLLLALTACDSGSTPSVKQPVADKNKPTPQAVSTTPIVIDPALAVQGEALYNQNCVFCHQPDAIGKPGFAPSLTNKELLSVSSNKFLLSTIRDGRINTGMPPFAHLGKEKIESIVAYLRSYATLPDRSAEIDAQPVSTGNAANGKVMYDQICLSCHGIDGDGYVAGGTGTAIGKAGFLSKVSDGFIRTTIKEGRSNTRMYGFEGPEAMADLSSTEIEDIIAYLRTVPSK